MYFKHFHDEDLAQSSFMLACEAEGTAIVIDARRDIGAYLEEAERQGFVITDVTETHIHADYVSGSRELSTATGARLHLSDEGDANWKYGFGAADMHDGDTILLGNVRLDVLHTPGHTPEHVSFLVSDLARSEIPIMLLTGDFVFVGDVGRPDLLDEAAGFSDTRFEAANSLFTSLQERFLGMADHVQVWPGHGAGSACGKALGAVPSTTVGYERNSAWWTPYILRDDRRGFSAALLEGQPDAPSYFGRMKRDNKRGPALLGDRGGVPLIAPGALAPMLGNDAVLFDTRAAHRYREDRVVHALFVPDGKRFVTYASFAFDPDRDGRGIVLLAPDPGHAARMRDALSRVGIDRVMGYIDTLDGLPRAPVSAVEPEDVERVAGAVVLDVRTETEHDAGHIPGARHVHVGRLRDRLDELPRDRPIVVHCQGGGRAAVAEGILLDAGFDHVLDLSGSYDAWSAWRRSRAEPA